MPQLPKYASYWVVWMSAAGAPKGTTLYKIQNTWGIRSNYLYHKEAKLRKPLFQSMIEEKYITKDKSIIKADFSWIPNYVIEQNKIEQKGWSPGLLILENWPLLQSYIQTNADVVFNIGNLKLLYKNNLHNLKRNAHAIFNDIFTLSLISSVAAISERYSAEVVESIIYTVISLYPGRDLYSYFEAVQNTAPLPRIFKNEQEMVRWIKPLKR